MPLHLAVNLEDFVEVIISTKRQVSEVKEVVRSGNTEGLFKTIGPYDTLYFISCPRTIRWSDTKYVQHGISLKIITERSGHISYRCRNTEYFFRYCVMIFRIFRDIIFRVTSPYHFGNTNTEYVSIYNSQHHLLSPQ